MSLSKLPRELMLDIVTYLPTAILSRLQQTCLSLHDFLGPVLTARITTENLASTVLACGIRNNHIPTVRLAIAHDASWHVLGPDRVCYSAVEHACGLGHTDILAALIGHYGAGILTDFHRADKSYYCHPNPLETALRTGNLALTTLLLENGFPANRVIWYRQYEQSPLDFAAKHGSAEIIEALFRHGAQMGSDGHCLGYAVENERWDVVSALLREGAPVWPPFFKWAPRFPLSPRSKEEIEAWVAGGKDDMYRNGHRGITVRIAPGGRGIRGEEEASG